MKRVFLTLIALLLILSTLASCGSTETPTENDPENENPNPGESGNDEPETAAEAYIADPSDIFLTGSSLYGNAFLVQPEQAYPGADPYAGHTSLDAAFVNQFLNAEDVIARGRSDAPLYGFYSFPNELTQFATDIADVGFTFMRTTVVIEEITDEFMLCACDSGIDVLCCTGAKVKGNTPEKVFYKSNDYREGSPELEKLENYDLVGWLELCLRQNYNTLSQYGPNGEFFERHPGVNNNPIRAIEVYGEPNYQYILPVIREDGRDAANNSVKTRLYGMMQVIMYHSTKYLYPDDPISGDPQVKVVGMAAGGNHHDCEFIEDALKLTNDTMFGTKTLYEILNETIAASEYLQEMTGFDGTTKKMDIDLAHTMDVLSTHHYIDQGGTPFSYVGATGESTWSAAGDVKRIRTALAQAGVPDMPVWYTEAGWEVSEAEGGIVENGRGGTQLNQAMMEVMYFMYGIRNGIDRISYMEIQDTDGCNYGLLNHISTRSPRQRDASWRQVMYAIQNMIRILPDPVLKNVVFEGLDTGKTYTTSGKDYAFIYEVESDIGGEIVTVVFSPIKRTAIRVPWTESYALMTDLFGATKLVAAENGYINVDAGPALVYLRVPTSEDLAKAGVVPTAAVAIADAPLLAWCGEKNEY